MKREKIAVDFGSSFTKIYKYGCGIVLCEPTVVAVNSTTGEVKAIGHEAKKLIGKTADNTKIVFPVFEGEIVNEEIAKILIREYLSKIGIKSNIWGVEAVVSIPCGASPTTLKKYDAVLKSAGITKIYFIESPLLSAIGQRLPINDFNPYFIIDLAGGVTSIATVTLDGVIAGISVNVGANRIISDIIDFVASTFDIQIGIQSAEKLKNEIGSLDQDDGLTTIVNGRDITTGTPKSISLRAVDIIPPIKKYVDKIVELAMAVLVKLPPEVSAEIRNTGVFVSGENAGLYGIKKYLEEALNMQVNIPKYPEMMCVLGGGIAVSDDNIKNKIAVKTE